MKKRDAILFKMKYLKIETQIEKSLTLFSRKISDFYVTTKSFKIQWYVREMKIAKKIA